MDDDDDSAAEADADEMLNEHYRQLMHINPSCLV